MSYLKGNICCFDDFYKKVESFKFKIYLFGCHSYPFVAFTRSRLAPVFIIMNSIGFWATEASRGS